MTRAPRSVRFAMLLFALTLTLISTLAPPAQAETCTNGETRWAPTSECCTNGRWYKWEKCMSGYWIPGSISGCFPDTCP